MPTLTCDPVQGIEVGSIFQPRTASACQLTGQQGPAAWPYMSGPAYFDSDLALFKNFQITERQKLQFRISAVNFLNHPLRPVRIWRAIAMRSSTSQNNYTISSVALRLRSAGNECAYALANSAVRLLPVAVACHPSVTGISPDQYEHRTTGTPKFKTGSRLLTFAVKYYF